MVGFCIEGTREKTRERHDISLDGFAVPLSSCLSSFLSILSHVGNNGHNGEQNWRETGQEWSGRAWMISQGKRR